MVIIPDKISTMHKNLEAIRDFWLSYCSLWEGEKGIQEQKPSIIDICNGEYVLNR